MNKELKQYGSMILASLSAVVFLSIAAWYNYEREGLILFLLISLMLGIYFYRRNYRN